MLSDVQSNDLETALRHVFLGTGLESGAGLTRRELLIGGLSSLFFGAAHNLTSSGFDTQTIPASQIYGGGVYWYFQRKFGIAANLTAHIYNNLRAVLSK